MAAGSIVLMAGPAQASLPSFLADNGISYQFMIDDTAIAVDYDMQSPTVVIPATIDDGGTTYNVTAIGDSAFSYNSIEDVTIGANVTRIERYAFGENLLTEVTIPASVTSIGYAAFYYNDLTSVTLNEGLTTLGNWVFESNPIVSITFPSSLTSLGLGVFYDGTLTSATFAGAAPAIVPGSGPGANPSLGRADGLTVHYLSEFEVDGGFTPGMWQGYASVADPVVSFNLGGHGTVDSQRVVAGSLAVAPDAPVRADWEFGGWYSDEALTTEFDFTVAPTENVTLFAQWMAVEAPVLPDASLSLNLGLAVGDVVAGAPVTVSGAGLKEGSDYTGILRSTPVLLVGGTVDSSGAFSDTGAFPTGLSAGQHTVTLSGTGANGSAVSTVAYLTVSTTGTVTYLSYSAAEAVTAVTATAALAETGVDGAPLGFAALLLLLAGAALVVSRRRSVA
jgi:uncharacterized repeat protein (TIGR02543 family)